MPHAARRDPRAANWGARQAWQRPYRPGMSTAAHRAPARWTIAGWNHHAAHTLWDDRLGPSAAEALAGVRLPAYRSLAGFLVLVVVAGAALLALPAGWPALAAAAALLVPALVIVAIGVRPLRSAGTAVREALVAAGATVDRAAPLNDGRRFDAWVRRNGLGDRVRTGNLAAVLRAVR